MVISICICTFNRCDILALCLDSFRHLINPGPEHFVEVIVVDNNSRDGTRNLVESVIPVFPFKVRYVFEAEQGISAARNRAIDEAEGDYLAFLDDECVVNNDWLVTAIADITQFRPSIMGGPFFGAFLPGDRPAWFKVEYGDASHFIDDNRSKGFHDNFRVCSGNMFVRRDVFETVRFNVNMGPKGTRLKVGEETELQDRFFQAHPSEMVFFDPKLIVRHFIRPEKMRLSYRAKWAVAASLATSNNIDYKSFLIALSKGLAHAVLSPVTCTWRDRAKYPFWQNAFYERVIPATCFRAGLVARYFCDWLCPTAWKKSRST